MIFYNFKHNILIFILGKNFFFVLLDKDFSKSRCKLIGVIIELLLNLLEVFVILLNNTSKVTCFLFLIYRKK